MLLLFYLESICFTLPQFYWFYLLLFPLGCNVNGVSGDGTSTVKGTCPETNQVCASNGMCEGRNDYNCQSQNKNYFYFCYFFSFTLIYFYSFCYVLLLSGCNVNMVSGDGTSTVKGTCPETYQVCASSGMCEGTNLQIITIAKHIIWVLHCITDCFKLGLYFINFRMQCRRSYWW